MKKLKIIGILLLVLGLLSYYFLDKEPYITFSGVITGIGVGLIIFEIARTRNS